jgi:hypothetical protein
LAIGRYDGAHVEAVLARDLEEHGAPFVLRLDRAKAHDVAPCTRCVSATACSRCTNRRGARPTNGQLERQNREHRAWLDADELDDDVDERLRHMKAA